MLTPGQRAWSTVFSCNVDVIRVYRRTATVRCWGRGLMEGKLITFRGQRLSSLEPARRIARDAEGHLVFSASGELEYER